jgi:anti-sigma factor RsiW
MKPLDDITLQRFLDGDLEADEAAQVSQALAQDDALAARLEAMTQIGGLVRDTFDQQYASVGGAEALFARISAELDAPGESQAAAPKAPELRVVKGGGKAAPRRTVMLPAFASLAAAAAVLLLFLGPHRTRDVGSPATPAGSQAVPDRPSAPAGSRIDDVDFGGSTGTVFEIDDDGVSAAVVWISDDDEVAP